MRLSALTHITLKRVLVALATGRSAERLLSLVAVPSRDYHGRVFITDCIVLIIITVLSLLPCSSVQINSFEDWHFNLVSACRWVILGFPLSTELRHGLQGFYGFCVSCDLFTSVYTRGISRAYNWSHQDFCWTWTSVPRNLKAGAKPCLADIPNGLPLSHWVITWPNRAWPDRAFGCASDSQIHCLAFASDPPLVRCSVQGPTYIWLDQPHSLSLAGSFILSFPFRHAQFILPCLNYLFCITCRRVTGYLCEANHDLAEGPTQANGLESCLFLGISPGVCVCVCVCGGG